MKQANAPKNTKENMSVFNLDIKHDYSDDILRVLKLDKETWYFPSVEKYIHSKCSEVIGCWRLTKKRENKNSEWEKVLDSKITREQRLNRLDIKFSSLN